MQFYETSAKSDYNVNEPFTFLTKEIHHTCDVKHSSAMKIEDKNKENKKEKDKCYK